MKSGSRDDTIADRRTNDGAGEPRERDTTVLIVDDDRTLVSLVRMYLEREGFEVVAAYDGEQALALIAHRQPQFVILDLMLPTLGA